MNYGIPKDLIKEKAPIVEYILLYYPQVELIKFSDAYIAPCPFPEHNDKSPSFRLSLEGKFKNKYKCFGCGEYGDVINFVMKMEDIKFKEACKMIADNVGVAYSLVPPNPHHEAYKMLMTSHNRRYWTCLKGSVEGLTYLKDTRKITDLSIKNFRLGMVPDDEYKNRQDLGGISGRIVFPIMETKEAKVAQCLAMGYRTLKLDEKKFKYINDCNQDGREATYKDDGTIKKPAQDKNLIGVFTKGECLYGYNLACNAIRKLDSANVVEGYMDVISMHQSNITNTVGIMNKSMTESQMESILKLTKNIRLFLDGDEAGVSGMIKLIPLLYAKGFNVEVVLAKNNKDPADVCMSVDFEESYARNYMDTNSKQGMMMLLDTVVAPYERTVLKERLKAINLIQPMLTSISNPVEKDIFTKLVYKKLDIGGI